MVRPRMTDVESQRGLVEFAAPDIDAGGLPLVWLTDLKPADGVSWLVQLARTASDVNIKKAAVTAAETDLLAAQAQVRSLAAQTRANRFKLEHAIENVNILYLLTVRPSTPAATVDYPLQEVVTAG